MTSLAVSGNWSVFHSFRDFFLVSRKRQLFQFLIVHEGVKLSIYICLFNTEVSVPHIPYTYHTPQASGGSLFCSLMALRKNENCT